jgi:hypothetical protein
MTIYNRNPDRDAHQIAIVGNQSLTKQNEVESKELKQKRIAEELKRQIEERDYHRAKEEWRKTKAASFVSPNQ